MFNFESNSIARGCKFCSGLFTFKDRNLRPLEETEPF